MKIRNAGRINLGGVDLASLRRNYQRMTPEQIYGKDTALVHQASQFQRLTSEIASRVGFKKQGEVKIATKSLWLHTKFNIPNHQNTFLKGLIEQDPSFADFVDFGIDGSFSASKNSSAALSAAYAKHHFGIQDADILGAIAHHKGDAVKSYYIMNNSLLSKILFTAFLVNGQKDYQSKGLHIVENTGNLDLAISYVLSAALVKGMPDADLAYLEKRWAYLLQGAEATAQDRLAAQDETSVKEDTQKFITKIFAEIEQNKRILSNRFETPHLAYPESHQNDPIETSFKQNIIVLSEKRALRSERVENILEFEGAELEGGIKISVLKFEDLNPYVQSQWDNHIKAIRINGENSGLDATVWINSLMEVNGRSWSIGGTRIQKYKSVEESLWDGARLSKGMKYKCGAGGIRIGGGKGDINNDPASPYIGSILFDYAKALQYLQVLFTGQDMNMNEERARLLAHLAPDSIVGVPGLAMGGIEPTPITAYGVYLGMRTYAGLIWPTKAKQSSPLEGRNISLQGVGGVGSKLITYLKKDGASITITDAKEETLSALRAQYGNSINIESNPDAIFDTPADIFSPNAKGAIIKPSTIERLSNAGVQLIAGAANNQLEDIERDGRALHEENEKKHRISYAPDYVINQGGLVGVASGVGGYDPAKQVENVVPTLIDIWNLALERNIPLAQAADAAIDEKFIREGWQFIR